jgi:hypothetical protein
MWSLYSTIYLTIYLLAVGLQEMKDIFSNLIFIWVKKDLWTSFKFDNK